MTAKFQRRQILLAAALAGLPRIPARADTAAVKLTVAKRTLEVNGRAASVYGVQQANGTAGLFLDPGQRFQVQLVNALGEDTIVHWHGQTPPVTQDGVALLGQESLIPPGGSQAYDFAPRTGTHWMHSHQGLQEVRLLSAPLVVRTQEDLRLDAQDVTILFTDFSFRSPEEIAKDLTGGAMPGMSGDGAAMTSGGTKDAPAADAMKDMPGMDPAAPATAPAGTSTAGMSKVDLNDVDYNAYLANDRTLDDPLVVRTERHGRVRLRLINASASTAFWIDTGSLDATVIAVDGTPVKPTLARMLPLSEAQRLDIIVNLPPGTSAPILARRVGGRELTGFVLASPGAAVAKLANMADRDAPALDNSLEQRLTASDPLLPRPIDVRHALVLTGSMSPYRWLINDHDFAGRIPLRVRQGQRVALDFENRTVMPHPMHLHGHSFQVIALDGVKVNGAIRDTVEVPPMGRVSVAFDADNPGRWVLHCHNAFHMESGMITELAYD